MNYPFTALHGQERLQTALLLAAVDPRIGGVLITGPRGTAKTTSARALAELLPESDLAIQSDESSASTITDVASGAFVNLPLGASEEQLVGSLDLEVVLQSGRVRFRPGLLARAHNGVLYVDEVNLLADTLVDLLLDVCASGVNRVERDGVSEQHAALITLVGTMNPEEGELRPQLLDRFGLFVDIDNRIEVSMREAIVRSRLSFDADPLAFIERFSAEKMALARRIADARKALSHIAFTAADHADVARRCHAAQVDGVRADLVMLRAARAAAALAGRASIDPDDIEAVAELVLAHRRKGEGDASDGNTGDVVRRDSNISDNKASDTNALDTHAGHANTGSAEVGGAGVDDAERSESPDENARGGESSSPRDDGEMANPTENHRHDPGYDDKSPVRLNGAATEPVEDDNPWGSLPMRAMAPRQVKTTRSLYEKKS